MGLGRIFLFFLAFALLEIMVISAVADLIGWPVTLGLVVATTLIGSALCRRQGLETWTRMNQRMQAGETPAQEMIEGVMLLIGSVFLVTPGFISDVAGLVLLIPYSRRGIAAWMIRKGRIDTFVAANAKGFRHGGFGTGGFQRDSGNVYDGEATEQNSEQGHRRPPLTLDENPDDHRP